MNNLLWFGIIFCLTQSAILSGLNLAVFSVGKLELKVLSKKGDSRARKLLRLRESSNFTLVTILWGNVAVNVLLAILSDSVMAPVAAFFFATVAITVFAEIIPQVYLTRHALRLIPFLFPILKIYMAILYPAAKPTAMVLNAWLGNEELRYFRERDLKNFIKLHMEAEDSNIGQIEGRGAINFLEIDDLPLEEEGELIDPESIIKLEFKNGKPVFPAIKPEISDKFLALLNRSGRSWAVITDDKDEPRAIIRTDDFIREALFSPRTFNPYRHCHRPVVVKEENTRLGSLMNLFRVKPGKTEDDILEYDIIILWDEKPRILTGSDILGRLLRGIAASD